jgi:hypothetical protein
MKAQVHCSVRFAVLSVLLFFALVPQTVNASGLSDTRDYSRIGIDTSPGGRCRFFTVDPAGNRTGMDPVSGRILLDIPHSGFGDESVEKTTPHYVLLISSPVAGIFETHLIGINEGQFEVDFTLISRSGRKNKQSYDFEGVIKPGREYIYQIHYSPEVGSVSSVVPATYLFGGFSNVSGKREINVFKEGTSVSVAFTISRRDGKPADDIKARLQVQKISSMKPFGEPVDATPASEKYHGNLFLFDPQKKEYVYQMDTSDLGRGAWKLIVLLDDGSRQTTWVGIE